MGPTGRGLGLALSLQGCCIFSSSSYTLRLPLFSISVQCHFSHASTIYVQGLVLVDVIRGKLLPAPQFKQLYN